MSESNEKNITMTFTGEGHTKLREMAKRYKVKNWHMLDAMIESVDEQAPEFKQRIVFWQTQRGTNAMSPELSTALGEAAQSLSQEEIAELLRNAAAAKMAN